MNESFAEILAVGGKTNSLGRANEVIEAVLADRTKLDELYACVHNDDAWVRMRAIDAMEKICRAHPEWIEPYIDRFQVELAGSEQPSIQWHLAQMYGQVKLSHEQRRRAITWLTALLASTQADWIVAANAMKTIVQFTIQGDASLEETIRLLEIQRNHKSSAVVRRADKLLAELAGDYAASP